METATDVDYVAVEEDHPMLENQEQRFSYRRVSELTNVRPDGIISRSDTSSSNRAENVDVVEKNGEKIDPIDLLVKEGQMAIKEGIPPVRNSKGSSGSYFIKDRCERNIGIFKPKDEEPYGKLNPKWLKWMHKTCLPCCFGRSCIIPNKGYLSEVGASLVDTFLGLNIVPKTTLAWLSSDVFNYSRIERSKMNNHLGRHKNELPAKIGSFQTFVAGYVDSSEVIYKLDKNFYETAVGREFLIEFQKLVILDYLIRNTDRGHDNWLVKIELNEKVNGTTDDSNNNNRTKYKSIKIAAIDNGLAFPFKHPDGWRLYPYSWAWLLPARNYTFMEEVVNQVLPILDDKRKVETLIYQLEVLFKRDKAFSSELFDMQMYLMRGQIANLRDALRARDTPRKLVEMELLYVSPVVEWASVRAGARTHQNNPTFSCI